MIGFLVPVDAVKQVLLASEFFAETDVRNWRQPILCPLGTWFSKWIVNFVASKGTIPHSGIYSYGELTPGFHLSESERDDYNFRSGFLPMSR